MYTCILSSTCSLNYEASNSRTHTFIHVKRCIYCNTNTWEKEEKVNKYITAAGIVFDKR